MQNVQWLVGASTTVVVTAAVVALLARGLRRAGAEQSGAVRLGPANAVTLVRASLVAVVTGLVVAGFLGPLPAWPVVVVTVPALLLDAVDGAVARRTRSVSAVGARFDMEIDAFLLLVLSVHVARDLGPWVLAIGLMRYAFVAAVLVLPWMSATLPYRYWRKVVTAAQGIALAVAAADLLPAAASIVLVAVALALLVESFGRDVVWLTRERRPRPRRTRRADRRPAASPAGSPSPPPAPRSGRPRTR